MEELRLVEKLLEGPPGYHLCKLHVHGDDESSGAYWQSDDPSPAVGTAPLA